MSYFCEKKVIDSSFDLNRRILPCLKENNKKFVDSDFVKSCHEHVTNLSFFTGPPLLNNNNNSSLTKSDNGKLKDFTQYEPLFNQVSDERRTINCFELQDLLETCLPNGKVILSFCIYLTI